MQHISVVSEQYKVQMYLQIICANSRNIGHWRCQLQLFTCFM